MPTDSSVKFAYGQRVVRLTCGAYYVVVLDLQTFVRELILRNYVNNRLWSRSINSALLRMVICCFYSSVLLGPLYAS